MATYGIKDKLKAGLETTGAVIKTVGKRMIGDDSPTELSPETKAIIDEGINKPKTPKKEKK